jgi:endonuclease V-like protein UPF0215 family
MIKKEIRIIAWDDCAFRFSQKRVLIVGAIFRGGLFLDGLLSTRIVKDGLDATDRIASSVLSSRHYDQLSLIMLDGITLAGFNLVDIKELNRKTKLPVIVVQRKKPDMTKFKNTLRIFRDYKKRLSIVKKAGRFFSFGKQSKIFYQKSGISNEKAEEILKITCTRSNLPEPVRVAHLIASGLSGESRGGV